jgi:recombination protein RecR
MDQYPRLLQDAVEQMATLPGIGRRTALRLVLDLLKRSEDSVDAFGNAFIRMRRDICTCTECGNLSESAICSVCADPGRDASKLCIVEDIRDVIAIEHTRQFKGRYHVLGGLISPMDGVGPQDLNIDGLEKRLNGTVDEIILALNTTMEGDTTTFYIYKRIRDKGVAITTLARGMSVGSELEYTDELTLGRSIQQRTPYENTLAR